MKQEANDPKFSEDDLLPLSAPADLVFCERRAALHHLEGIWTDNVFTVEGTFMHQRVHSEEPLESRGDLRIARGLRLRSLRLGLSGIADVVEFHRVGGHEPLGTGDQNASGIPLLDKEGARGWLTRAPDSAPTTPTPFSAEERSRSQREEFRADPHSQAESPATLPSESLDSRHSRESGNPFCSGGVDSCLRGGDEHSTLISGARPQTDDNLRMPSPGARQGSALPPGVPLPGARGLWQPFPVEYKRGRLRREEGYEVQLCAQALCLEEMLTVAVPVGAVFYGQPRKRLEVVFGEELRRETGTAAARLHELIRARNTPPARYEKKCESCSLLTLCMPKTTGGRKSVDRYLAGMLEHEGLPPPADGWAPGDS